MKTDIAFTRRAFCKAAAAASAATLLSGGVSACSPETKAQGRIRVHHEWDPLRAAVVGIPWVRLPEAIPPALRKLLSPRWLSFLESAPGGTLEEADPRLFARVSREMDAAVRILEDHGVTVLRPGAMTPDDERYLADLFPPCGSQLYPRDPLLVIGDHLIETEPAFPWRRRERFGIRRALAGHLPPEETAFISMPPAMPHHDGRWNDGPLLEGGDVLVLGRDILVGLSGNASNAAGARWLARILGSEYRVHEVPLSRRFLHLDCCLCTPRPGLAVICREAFTHGLPECLNRWQLIDVSPRDAGRYLACNGLILDEKTMILGREVPKLASRLRAAGQTVIETPFDAVTFFGGSLRCWHQPLVRGA